MKISIKKSVVFTLSAFFLLTSVTMVNAREVSAVTLNWEPHYGESMKDHGALTVIVKEAMYRGGHTLVYDFISWERALSQVASGETDIVMGAYYSEKRNKIYLFSDVIYTVDFGLITLDTLGVKNVKNLRDLQNYTIGISRGYAHTEEFDNADFLKKESANGPVQNIRKLFRKRVDMVAGSFDIYGYQAKKEGLCVSRMVFVQPPLKSQGIYLMASRNIPDGAEIIDDFNAGLASMKQDGTLQAMLSRYLR